MSCMNCKHVIACARVFLSFFPFHKTTNDIIALHFNFFFLFIIYSVQLQSRSCLTLIIPHLNYPNRPVKATSS